MQAHPLAASCIIKLCALLALAVAVALLAVQPDVRALRQNAPSASPSTPRTPFDEWLKNLIQEAHDRGYSETLVDQTLAGLKPLPRVIQNDRAQAELVVGFDRYYRARINARFVQQGREMARGSQRSALERRKEIRGSATIRPRHLGDRNALRPREGQYARLPGAGHAGVGAATVRLLSRRAVRRADDGVERTHRCRKHDRLVGGCDGPPAVHAVKLSEIRAGFRRRRPHRHLAINARRARVNRQLSRKVGLGRRVHVGARGARHAGRSRAHRQGNHAPHRGLLCDAEHDRAHPAHATGNSSASDA